MIPRAKSTTPPDHAFVVDYRDEDDPHHFVTPTPSACGRVLEWAGQTGRTKNMSERISLMAVALGVSWSHQDKRLETEPPTPREHRESGVDAWDAYSEAVQDEMVRAGYSTRDILEMGAACLEQINGWANELMGAREQADFTEPTEEPKNA